MTDARARRTLIAFLVILTLVVFLRLASSARGSTPSGADSGFRSASGPAHPRVAAAGTGPGTAPVAMQIEESGGLLLAASTAHRTLVLRGLQPRSGDLELDWEARVAGDLAARGSGSVMARSGGVSRLVLSIPLPAVERPAGLDLEVRARDAGRLAGEAIFPFTLYPAGARPLADLLAHARVALYDPEGKAAPALASLGLSPEVVRAPENLALYRGDLIVVGPGGFARGREALGPVLAARARSGMPVLILDQPSLPGTLSEDLRLWPSFSVSPETSVLFSAGHPILDGLAGAGGPAYFAAARSGVRPLLPPTRGNFRIVAELRVRSGPALEEGVSLLEFALGSGTIVAAQAALCDDFRSDARARILLANTLAYLLGGPRPMKKTVLYGQSLDDLPACLSALGPRALPAPADLEGVEVLLMPGDWRAPRLRGARGLPPLARVASFLHEGGTVLLLNPQTLVLDFLRGLSGAGVYFEAAPDLFPARDQAGEPGLLQGIGPEDLALLARPGRAEFRLRALPGADGVEPTLIIPGLARYRVGAGTLVALALPDTGDCSLPRISSLLARLLTNLGVPLDPGPGIDPEAITRLSE